MVWNDLARSWLAIGVLAALALLLVQRALWRWFVRWGMSRRAQRARRAELNAPRWLERHGYRVTAAQVARDYTLLIDEQPVAIHVRADYLVERAGLSYVAEVKSGLAAPSLQTQATRRQLLEYRIAFDVDGVLLVDAETERVHVVRFPLGLPQRAHGLSLAWVVAALVFGLCLLAWVR